MLKSSLLALVLLAGAGPALAQTTPTLARPLVPIQYCTLVAQGTHYSALSFQLDYGQNAAASPGMSADQLKEDNAKIRELFSVADALNYLSSRGWEVVGVSTLTGDVTAPESTPAIRGGSILGTFRSEVQYLLRRRGQ